MTLNPIVMKRIVVALLFGLLFASPCMGADIAYGPVLMGGLSRSLDTGTGKVYSAGLTSPLPVFGLGARGEWGLSRHWFLLVEGLWDEAGGAGTADVTFKQDRLSLGVLAGARWSWFDGALSPRVTLGPQVAFPVINTSTAGGLGASTVWPQDSVRYVWQVGLGAALGRQRHWVLEGRMSEDIDTAYLRFQLALSWLYRSKA